MLTAMTSEEKAIAYLAVEVENGSKITGLQKADAEAIADFARCTLGCKPTIRPCGPPWRRTGTYTVSA